MTNTAATIHHGGNRAFYAPARDAIQLPPFEAFKDKESYVANARDPKQDERFRKMREFLAADPEWHDGEIIRSDSA